MVLGVKAKGRRSPTVQLDYLVHVQEVKPWPPSQSLKTLRSVLIQWENGDRNAGSTKAVVPNLGSGVSDGKIVFNESFRVPVTLVRDMSIRGGDGDAFQKNYLEFNLYEPRRDKTVKGQLLGTATIDLAAYSSLVKESVSVSVPVNSKRSFRNTAQPLLFVKLQLSEKGRSSSSSRENLSKEASMDRSVGESVSALMNEEYAEEAETASMTDDDVSSHSSLAVSSSAFESNGGLSPHSEEAMKDSPKETYDQQLLTSEQGLVKFGRESVQGAQESLKDGNVTHCGAETNFRDPQGSARNEPNGSAARVATPDRGVKVSSAASVNQEDSDNCQNSNTEVTSKHAGPDVTQGQDGSTDDRERAAHPDNGHEASAAHEGPHPTNGAASEFTQLDTNMSVSSGSDGLSSSEENIASNSYILNGDKSNHFKSVRSSVESFRNNGSVKGSKFADLRNGSQSFISNERKDTRVYGRETRNIASDNKIQQLENKLKMLEGELREAAAIEVGLYSVVAEHGSSITKLHAPARRLSRLYLHACKESSQSRRGHAARSAVSGLVLVAKACGNDVPRLTFWLSNSIVLRAIISRASTKQLLSPSAAAIVKPGGQWGNQNRPSSLKWKEFSPSKDISSALSENTADWSDPHAFTSSLEKIEAWIFSRIIESVWWQTLTPHMQSAAAKSINTSGGKTYRASRSDDQEQVIFSLELWKKAFKDACERLCPVRAAGHDCGCLPVLARLIMEQCVARLDVAMFNAILRESGDEIPTDPVSDPVSDAKVLPIQAGKASFGAGAQLKNAIGNWSRWLTDLFGIDDDDLSENEDNQDENDARRRGDTSSTCFRLLNALSDLMMLPKDMLLSRSIRKEVCPAFAAPMIRRVLDNFVPDEFCPDPIPEPVLEALDSEDPLEAEEGTITNFPCTAAPIVYSPPPAASVAGILSDNNNNSNGLSQLRRSGSSVLKKSHTSDDELDEFESPLAAIINTFEALPTARKPRWTQENGGRHAVRYQLLREVWMNSE